MPSDIGIENKNEKTLNGTIRTSFYFISCIHFSFSLLFFDFILFFYDGTRRPP